MAALGIRVLPGQRVQRLRWAALANGLLAAGVLYLVLLPLVTLVYSSLKASGTQLPWDVPGLSLGNFSYILNDPATLAVASNTAIFVGGSLVLGLGLSLGLVYLLERTDLPGASVLGTLTLSPMAVPAVVMAIAWSFLANPTNGPLSLAIHQLLGVQVSIYSLGGMVIVTGIIVVPSMYLLIAPQFARLDAALEDAASVSGAGWLARTRLIVLPLLTPAVVAAAMLLIVVSTEAFDVPAILGFPRNIYVFSTLIQQSIQPPNGSPNYGRASGYGMLLLAVAVCLIGIYRRTVRSATRFQTVTGRGYRPTPLRLGRWRRLAVAGVLLYLMMGVVAPLLILLWASLLPYFSLPSWSMLGKLSLANYQALLALPGVRAAASHTAVIVLVSATVTMALAFFTAWVSVRRRFPGSWLLAESSFLVLGVPGVVMGVSLVYLYLRVPLPIYGTIWIIVVAYVTRFLAYGVRLMDASFRQLARELEEAGQMTGAPPFTVTRKIVLPLMLPAVLRGWLWVAVHALKELPMALILTTSANQTLTVALWQMWTDDADYSTASALAVLLSAISALAIWLVNRRADAATTAASAV